MASPTPLETLAEALSEHLSHAKSIHRIENVRAIANCTKIVLIGNSNSYYHKQIVQEMARTFLKGRAFIRNNIHVVKEMAQTNPPDFEH